VCGVRAGAGACMRVCMCIKVSVCVCGDKYSLHLWCEHSHALRVWWRERVYVCVRVYVKERESVCIFLDLLKGRGGRGQVVDMYSP